jgi:hypothetical protein
MLFGRDTDDRKLTGLDVAILPQPVTILRDCPEKSQLRNHCEIPAREKWGETGAVALFEERGGYPISMVLEVIRKFMQQAAPRRS